MSKLENKNKEMLENVQKLNEINDEDIEEIISNEENNIPETVIENDERVDIDNIVSEEDLKEPKTTVKVKEIKYGFSVLTNIGNYENIRTQIEVSAEIGEEDNITEVLDVLSTQVKDWGRREYKDIKRRVKQ